MYVYCSIIKVQYLRKTLICVAHKSTYRVPTTLCEDLGNLAVHKQGEAWSTIWISATSKLFLILLSFSGSLKYQNLQFTIIFHSFCILNLKKTLHNFKHWNCSSHALLYNFHFAIFVLDINIIGNLSKLYISGFSLQKYAKLQEVTYSSTVVLP